MKKDTEPYQRIEQSITKKFHRELWNPFVDAVKRYELISAEDRIAVCVSGGKDSMLMAEMMRLFRRYGGIPFEMVYLVMDPGYDDADLLLTKSNAELLRIPVTVFRTNVFAAADSAERSPCALCAKMRRGHLYKKAKELGCSKIALGHHLNDVIETTVMGMFYSSQLQAMIPKLHSKNFAGMELIRPLYRVREEDIVAWQKYNGLKFVRCACRFAKNSGENGGEISKRQEIKTLIKQVKRVDPRIEKSIFNSIHNVNIDTFPGYKKDGGTHSFLEEYDR